MEQKVLVEEAVVDGVPCEFGASLAAQIAAAVLSSTGGRGGEEQQQGHLQEQERGMEVREAGVLALVKRRGEKLPACSMSS